MESRSDGLRLPPPWISPAAGEPDREVRPVITVQRRRAAPSGGGIVTSNLGLYLDAANAASYGGTGAAWLDLSGSGNHYTLTNGPVFNSANGGSFVFNGSSQYATPGKNFTGFGTAFTVSHFVYLAASQQAKTVFSNISTAGTGWVTGIGDGAAGDKIKFYQGSQTLLSPSTVATSTWLDVTITHGSGISTMFINNVQVATSSNAIVYSGSAKANDIARLASASGEQYFNGRVGDCLYYSRAISVYERTQNFDFRRGRFGV